MARLFVTLYLLVVLALAVFWAVANYLPDYLLRDLVVEIAETQYAGTLALLEDEVADLEGAPLRDKVTQLQGMFGYFIDLLDVADLDLTAREQRLLDAGRLVPITRNNADVGVYRSARPGKAWYMQTEPTDMETAQLEARGTLKLIEDRLRGHPVENWPQVVTAIAVHFHFPLVLVDYADLSIEQTLKSRLQAGHTVATHYDENGETFYHLLDGQRTWVLRAGPIQYPYNEFVLSSAIVATLIILLAAALFFWTRPVWLSLQSMRHAAEQIAAGDFSARVEERSRSGMRVIQQAFNAMASHIQSLLSSHRELTNAVSHELRTPVSRLRFSLEMLREEQDEQPRARHLSNMAKDIDELDELLNELLTYARFDRDQSGLTLTDTDLAPLVESETQRFAEFKPARLSISTRIAETARGQTLPAEPRLIRRALSNLLSNALRHARRQVRVRVLDTPQHLQLRVDDDGPGIPGAALDTLFDPFSRIDQSRSRATGGFGLGLSIVKRIVDWHHGDIEVVESELGGAGFIISLPKQPS